MITLSDIQRTAEFAKVLDGAALTVNTNTGDASDSSSEPMETDSSPAGPGIDPANESFSDIDSSSNGQATSIEDFQVQLDRRSIIGATGERIAFEDEIRRLRSKEVGCPDPERHVNHIALSDVARGYDIESTWPGQERCIEVKSSTSASNPIFMSSNERAVLEKLGKKAWVYRVIIDTDGNGQVTLRLNDPISIIPEENFSTAVWAVRLPKADQ